MLRAWQKCGFLVFFAVTAFVNALAQDHHVARQFDPTVTLDIDTGKLRYDFYVGREKSEELEAGDAKFGGGVSFRVKPIFKTFIDELDTDKQHVLVLRFGYEYLHGGEEERESTTHTVMADGTVRWAFPKKILVSDRSRVQFRWIDGEPSLRYRNRLQVERPFRLFKRNINPYGSAEAYWDSRFRSWNKFRYAFGTEIQTFWITTLDIYYTRERCVTCPDPHTDILGLNIHFFLKLKK